MKRKVVFPCVLLYSLSVLYPLGTVMEKERQLQLILVPQCKEVFESYVDFEKQCIFTVMDQLIFSD